MDKDRKGILQRLSEGPVIGDGSMCMTLEKRGYCRAGPWTPEAVVEYPDAVLQLQREYLRAGADVIQTASFYASDDKLCIGAGEKGFGHTSTIINREACNIARKVADEGNALVCGSISPVPSYVQGKGEVAVKEEFVKQVEVYKEYDIDFIVAEFFSYIEELEIACEVAKSLKKPIALNMRTALLGDESGVSFEECVSRMAKTGAEIVGLNCMYDVNTHLKSMKKMKEVLDKEELDPYLMCQPIGWMCPEVEDQPIGYMSLPECPLALDPRTLTRIEVHKFTRAAWELGVRYIGGCCGFEPHHIRAIAQELSHEKMKSPPCQEMCPQFGKHLELNMFSVNKKRVTRDYWFNVNPGFGRPFNAVLAEPEKI